MKLRILVATFGLISITLILKVFSRPKIIAAQCTRGGVEDTFKLSEAHIIVNTRNGKHFFYDNFFDELRPFQEINSWKNNTPEYVTVTEDITYSIKKNNKIFYEVIYNTHTYYPLLNKSTTEPGYAKFILDLKNKKLSYSHDVHSKQIPDGKYFLRDANQIEGTVDCKFIKVSRKYY
mgnify:CR=1 FL=1